MNTNLNELRDRAYETACYHGLHDKELSNQHLLMLVITELAEAVEADRKGKVSQRRMFEMNCDTPNENPKHHWCFCFEHFVKDSIQDELADAVIRLLDLAGYKNIDIKDFAEDEIDDLSESCNGESFTETIYAISTIPIRHEYEYGYSLDKQLNGMLLAIIGFAKYLDIDLFWHIEQKMRYNDMRPSMHGEKY